MATIARRPQPQIDTSLMSMVLMFADVGARKETREKQNELLDIRTRAAEFGLGEAQLDAISNVQDRKTKTDILELRRSVLVSQTRGDKIRTESLQLQLDQLKEGIATGRTPEEKRNRTLRLIGMGKDEAREQKAAADTAQLRTQINEVTLKGVRFRDNLKSVTAGYDMLSQNPYLAPREAMEFGRQMGDLYGKRQDVGGPQWQADLAQLHTEILSKENVGREKQISQRKALAGDKPKKAETDYPSSFRIGETPVMTEKAARESLVHFAKTGTRMPLVWTMDRLMTIAEARDEGVSEAKILRRLVPKVSEESDVQNIRKAVTRKIKSAVGSLTN